jgi:hypothetical protein
MLGSRVVHAAHMLFLGVALSVLSAPIAAHAQNLQSPSLDLDLRAYEAELDRCAAAIKHLAEITPLRKSLPRFWFVRTQGSRVAVSTAWLTHGLEKIEREPANSAAIVSEIESRLTAMHEAASDLEQASSEPLIDARERLDKIFQRREFSGMQGPSQLELLQQRITRWVLEQIAKLLSRLHLGAAAGNVIAWTIVGLAFLALCYWVFQSLSGRSRPAETPAADTPESPDARQWASDALVAAERGDYREAVHCGYWAAVVHLEGLGVLKRDHARTPRESLRLLDLHPNEQTLLREFTRHFELIWYGYRPASAEDWSDARVHLEKIGCLTPSTAATANS